MEDDYGTVRRIYVPIPRLFHVLKVLELVTEKFSTKKSQNWYQRKFGILPVPVKSLKISLK